MPAPSGEARLFLGLELTAEAKAALTNVRQALQRANVQGKLYDESLYHLTLCFLGGTPRRAIARIERLMNEPSAAPLTLTLAALHTFKNGSILWAGIQPCPQLMEYQACLADILLQNGFPVEEGAYTPHITLGRQMRSSIPRLTVPPVDFSVCHATLFESTRVAGKLAYVPLYRSAFRQKTP